MEPLKVSLRVPVSVSVGVEGGPAAGREGEGEEVAGGRVRG